MVVRPRVAVLNGDILGLAFLGLAEITEPNKPNTFGMIPTAFGIVPKYLV